MDTSMITWVSLGINVMLALLGFLGKRAYVAMEEKMAATVTSIDDIRHKVHSIEVELPKVYATKAELLQAQQETKAILKDINTDLRDVLIAVSARPKVA